MTPAQLNKSLRKASNALAAKLRREYVKKQKETNATRLPKPSQSNNPAE